MTICDRPDLPGRTKVKERVETTIWPRETQIEKDFDQAAGRVNFKVSSLEFGIYK